jgi:hypothetical protein
VLEEFAEKVSLGILESCVVVEGYESGSGPELGSSFPMCRDNGHAIQRQKHGETSDPPGDER